MAVDETVKFEKDPDEVLDYKLDWAKWLAPTGDSIDTSTFTVKTAGITKNSDSKTSTNTTVWLSGGTPGNYRIENLITTTQGRTAQRSITIKVKDK